MQLWISTRRVHCTVSINISDISDRGLLCFLTYPMTSVPEYTLREMSLNHVLLLLGLNAFFLLLLFFFCFCWISFHCISGILCVGLLQGSQLLSCQITYVAVGLRIRIPELIVFSHHFVQWQQERPANLVLLISVQKRHVQSCAQLLASHSGW